MTEQSVTITLTIPEWALGRHIYVIAGGEVIAYKNVAKALPDLEYGPLMIKTVRCDKCGECCRADGCEYLKHEVWNGVEVWVCDESKLLMGSRPFNCVIGNESSEPHCCIEYKEGE